VAEVAPKPKPGVGVYFPNLNGIRALAASMVVVHHTAELSGILKFHNAWDFPRIVLMGHLAVVAFFVLSGFLITFLLKTEMTNTGKINVPKFYLRRALRIWPVYYTVVLAAFVVIPQFPFFRVPQWSDYLNDGLALKVWLFVLFLPNIAQAMLVPVAYASPLWSVGVEEQFYLTWPIVLRDLRLTSMGHFYLLLIWLFAEYALKVALQFSTSYNFQVFGVVVACFNFFPLLVGALFATLLFERQKAVLKLLYTPAAQWLSLLGLLAMLISNVQSIIPFSVFFGVGILNLASNPRPLFRLEWGPLNYLGKISYGMYMYHQIAVVAALQLVRPQSAAASIGAGLLAYLGSIALAHLSYTLMEQPFLRWKTGFAVVQSGTRPTAKD
jgi:peptidoglycan/LPS O-acetylase OafA/YrhL